MDYHSMKRRELQALCKEHNIPANSANSVMADKLSELLKEKQKPRAQQQTCMKSLVETVDESEPALSRRQAKKVRFSPDVDLLGSKLRSGTKRKAMVTDTKVRKKSVANKVDYDDDNVQLIDDDVQIPVRLTRSRVQTSVKDGVVPTDETKQGRRAIRRIKTGTDAVKETEDNIGKVTMSKVHNLEKNKQSKGAVNDVKNASEPVDEKLVGRIGATRSKAQSLIKGGMGPDVNPQVKQRSGRRVAKDAENVEPPKESVDVSVRVTRAKGQTLMDDSGNTVAAPQAEKKRTRRNGRQVAKDAANVEPPKESVDVPVRVTRAKGQTLMDDSGNTVADPQAEKKRTRRNGRQVGKDAANVEPPKESVDFPVRVTRAVRRQMLTDDSGNTDADSQVEKKRTRRDTRDADLGNKSSNVAPDDNQQFSDRKLLRNRGVDVAGESEKLGHGRRNKRREETIAEGSESQDHADKGLRQSRRNKSKDEVSTVLDQNVNKMELVNDRKVTRSRAHLTTSSGGNNKSEFDNKIEEPLEHAGRRNATRRKSVIQPEKTEMVLHIEPPVRRQSRNDTRQKSVMQELDGKEIGKSLVGNKEIEKENEMVGSPNSGTHRTVGRKQSKEQCGNLSMVDEGFDIKENVSGSGKATSENKMKTVASAVGSNKSRKRRGYSTIEDQIIVTKYVSPDIVSPKRSTRSASKSEVKPVTHPHQNSVRKKQESTLKTSARRMDNTSDKRVKLSGTNQSDSEDHAEKSDTKGTPVSKLGNFALDEEVIQTKHTPVIDDSVGRLTRSAIRSERNAVASSVGKAYRKKLSQSAIKDQHTGDAPRSSRKVTNFRRDSVLNTAPGRFTRSGIKHAGNAGPGPSEVSKGGKGQRLDHSSELLASDSERLPIKVVEENVNAISETFTFMESVNSVSGEFATDLEKEVTEIPFPHIEKTFIQSTENPTKPETSATPHLTENLLGQKQQTPVNLPNSEDEVPSGTSLSDIKRTPFPMAEVSATQIDALSDGSHLQNQNQEVSVKSAIFVEAEDQEAVESENLVLKPVRPEVQEKEMESIKSGSSSMGLQDVMEEPVVSVGKNDVMEITKENDGDAFYAGSSTACHLLSEQSDVKRKSIELLASLESPILEGVEQLIADDGAEQDALTLYNSLENHPLGGHEVADNDEHDDVDKTAKVADDIDAHEMDSVMEEYDLEPNKDNALEQPTGNDHLQGPTMDEFDDKFQGLVSDENEIKVKFGTARDRCDVADNVVDDAGKELAKEVEFDENEIKDNIGTARDRCDVSDNVVDAGKELANEVEFQVVPSTGNDVREIRILGKTDSEDVDVNHTKDDGEADSTPLTAANMLDDSVPSGGDGEDESASANKEHKSSTMLPTIGGFETSILSNVDDVNMNRNVGVSDTSVMGKDDVEGNSVNMRAELEPVIEPLNAINTFEVPVSDKDEHAIGDKNDEKEEESEQEQKYLIRNDSSFVEGQHIGDDEPKPSQSENIAELPEVLVPSSDQEREPILNAAVDVCVSVGESDSLMSKETPKTPATDGNDVMVVGFDALEPKIDINNDYVSNDSRDSGVHGNAMGFMDTKIDTGNEQKIMETSEVDEGILSLESEGVSIDMSNEWRAEEGELTTENDNEQIIATVAHDLDKDKVVEDRSSHKLDESDSQLVIIQSDENPTGEKSSPSRKECDDQLMGDIGGHENLITEEDLTITFKNEEPPVDDMVSDPSTPVKDDNEINQESSQNTNTPEDMGNYSFRVLDEQDAALQTSARASSSIQGTSSLAVDFVDPVTNMEKASRYVADEKSNQDVEMLEENANAYVSGESVDWSDSSLKALFTTPASTRIGHVINGSEDVSFLFRSDSQDNDVGRNGTAAPDFNCQWENEPSRVSNDKNQGYATQSTSLRKDLIDEHFGVSNPEDYDDKKVDGSGKKEHIDFKDEQVKQHDLLIESAGTHHSDYFSFNDDFVIEEPAQQEGSETGDDSAH